MAALPECVFDTSALIDFDDAHGGVLRAVLGNCRRAIALDLFIGSEIDAAAATQMEKWGLEFVELDGPEIDSISQEMTEYPISGAGFNDYALVHVASREIASVVSSNYKHVPRIASRHSTNVIGTLAVLDRLVSAAVLDPLAAAFALQRMIVAGSYLPLDRCGDRIDRWKQGQT